MLTKSPSGALSPYYYKGGYFHGIHYGSYFDDANALLGMMQQEEAFILKSPQQRRILIDVYETSLPKPLVAQMAEHIGRISPRVVKLAITGERKKLHALQRALYKEACLGRGQLYFGPDMETAKTWLVSD